MSEARDTRFRKGQSGNPRGRPPKSKAPASVLSAILEETLTVKQNGIERVTTIEEPLQLRQMQAAMKGDPRAIRLVIKMIAEREAWRQKRSGKDASNPEVVLIRERDSDNAFEAMLLLGIAEENPERPRQNIEEVIREGEVPIDYGWLMIHDWAIEAARAKSRVLYQDKETIEQIDLNTFSRHNFTFEDLK